MMPNGDPSDGFFYLTLTFMIDSSYIACVPSTPINSRYGRMLQNVEYHMPWVYTLFVAVTKSVVKVLGDLEIK